MKLRIRGIFFQIQPYLASLLKGKFERYIQLVKGRPRSSSDNMQDNKLISPPISCI